eukprot:4346911-Pyramimonas_sp.AAC.1
MTSEKSMARHSEPRTHSEPTEKATSDSAATSDFVEVEIDIDGLRLWVWDGHSCSRDSTSSGSVAISVGGVDGEETAGVRPPADSRAGGDVERLDETETGGVNLGERLADELAEEVEEDE